MSNYQTTFTNKYKVDITDAKERTMDTKDPSAIVPITFNFKNLPDGAFVVSANFDVSVKYPTDATDTTPLVTSGAPAIIQDVLNEAKITQRFIDGTSDIVYLIKVSILTGDGNLFVGSAFLEVRAN